MEYNELASSITNLIGIMSVEDKPSLVRLLKKSGSYVTDLSTNEEILDAAFKSLKNSKRFRDNLNTYFVNTAKQVPEPKYDNYVDSDFFNVLPVIDGSSISQSALIAAGRTPVQKYNPTTATGGTKVGNAIRSIFSQENIDTIVKTGISVAATKLTANATKQSEQRAIDFEIAQAQAAALQTQQISAAKNAGFNPDGTPIKKNKWIMPVVIILVVTLIGFGAYYMIKKKKV